MWAPLFAIFAFTGAVRCDCPWRECISHDDIEHEEYDMVKNISYRMDQALLYTKFHDGSLRDVTGFHEELPGVYFLSEWLPLQVTWNLSSGYLFWGPFNNLRPVREEYEWYEFESYDQIYMKRCTFKSDKGVLLKKTLEGAVHYDDFREQLGYSSFQFPHWTWEIDDHINQNAHYKFAFSFTVEYNSTFCELTNIQWTLAEGSYVINTYSSILLDLKPLFRFKIPEEHVNMIKEQIHLMFDTQVVGALCTRFRPDE